MGAAGGGAAPVDRLFSPAETVSVAFCLASALAHLHAHGALHYDVKPANTLFFDGDHVPPRARSARLADFGEARMKRDGTTTGGKRGTDAFMAPEVMNNMRALRARCKEGADIWSLGATLFALLTGRELGKSEELLDVLEANVKMLEKGALDDWDREQFFAVDSPTLAAAERAAWAAAPAPLRGLIVDCLALAPEKRPSAQQLLDTPLLVAERAAEERERAVEEAVVPLKAEILALKDEDSAQKAELRALKAENTAQKEELRMKSEEMERLAQQMRDHHCPDPAPLLAENAALKARLAELHAKIGGGGGGAPAMVMRYAGGPLRAHCVAKLAHKGAGDVTALAVVEGVGLVSGGENFYCSWALGADKGLKSIEGRAFKIAALSGERFAVAGAAGPFDIEMWDAGTGKRLHQLRGHNGGMTDVIALPGGLLVSGNGDKTVRTWNAATGAQVATLEGNTDVAYAFAALPGGRFASGHENTIRLWSMATRACTLVLPHPSNTVWALAVLDGGRLASGCRGDNYVHIWSLDGGVHEAVLEGHTESVCPRSLAALPSGLLASGSHDKTVRVWDVGARACVAVLEGHGGMVRALAALPDGRLASGSYKDPMIRVWALTAPGSPEDAAAAAEAARGVTIAAAP